MSAMAIKLEEKSLEKLEQEITCSVCQEYYTEPKVLPCLHYYCKKCVLKLALRMATGEPFSCPECRKDTTLPEGGVDELKTAFFINRLQSEVVALKQVHGKEEVNCEMCTDSESKAEAFCHQCEEYICKECIMLHQRLKKFTLHEIVSLKDMKREKVKKPVKKCLIHEEPLIVYCFDCNSLVCRDCTMTNHKEHKFEFVKVAASDTKKKLLEEIVPLREVLSDMTQALEKVHSTKSEVEAEGKSVTDTILASFDELQQMLEKGKLQLLQEASSIAQQKLEKLAAQGEKLSRASASVQSIIDYTERLVDHCSDNEVMSMHTEIRENVVQRIEATMKPKTIQKQEDNAGGVSGLKPPEQVGQEFGSMAWDVSQCIVRGEGMSVGTVGEVSTLILSANHKCHISSNHYVAGKLMSRRDNSFMYCDVSQSGPGEYRIQYTPTVRGRHNLSVLVDGQDIPGSPFSVMVSIPPAKLAEPVKKLQISCRCYGIVVNSRGELVAITDKGVVVIGWNGQIQRTLVQPSSLKSYACSIAIDKFDAIYCASANQLLRYNQRGVVDVKQVDISCTALRVVGDELITCNGRNTIKIYDRDLNYVRSIEYRAFSRFRDVSSDSQGNLYAAALDMWHRSGIAVFSNAGNYLRSFGMGSFKQLQSLCVSGQYVYVIDNQSECIHVFTTAGDCVTSIAHNVQSPTCLCVDNDEFVWVINYQYGHVF